MGQLGAFYQFFHRLQALIPGSVRENGRDRSGHHLVDLLWHGDHQLSPGVPDLLGYLQPGVKQVSCGEDGTNREHVKAYDWIQDRVGGKNKDDITLPNLERMVQASCKGLDRPSKLSIGDPAARN